MAFERNIVNERTDEEGFQMNLVSAIDDLTKEVRKIREIFESQK